MADMADFVLGILAARLRALENIATRLRALEAWRERVDRPQASVAHLAQCLAAGMQDAEHLGDAAACARGTIAAMAAEAARTSCRTRPVSVPASRMCRRLRSRLLRRPLRRRAS